MSDLSGFLLKDVVLDTIFDILFPLETQSSIFSTDFPQIYTVLYNVHVSQSNG